MTGTPFSILKVEENFSLDDCFRAAPLTLSRLWNGTDSGKEIQIVLALSPKSLFFAAWGVGETWNFPGETGSYYQGLWERDVAELFITEGEGTGYREIHLSPNGLWWVARFQDFRVRDDAFPCPEIILPAASRRDENGWRAAIEIPHTIIQLDFFSQKGKRANLSGIFGYERDYLSWNAQPKLREPDFHRCDLFGGYELKPTEIQAK